jgi:two-component system NtrC family sensor kinase
MTRDYLTLRGGYELDSVSRVDDFWAQIARKQYDVFLLDYNLPDGNGLEILQGLAANKVKTPTVMITGRGDERIASKTVLAGASEYIVKSGRYLEELPTVIARVVEQGRLQQALDEAIARYRDLFEQAGEGIALCAADGTILAANPILCKWLNISRDALIGENVEEIDQGYAASAAAPIREQLSQAGTLTYESTYRRKDGSTFPVEITAKVVQSHNGSGEAMQFFIRDVTELRLAQAQLIRAARLSAVGELAAGVAHQINNPLTTVIADAQLLVKALPPDHAGYPSAAAIFQAGWRAQRVVQRLLNFSRPDELAFAPTDLNESIMEAIDLISAYFERDGIQVEVALAPSLPQIPANGHQLEEVWINLLMNARDALRDVRPAIIRVTSELCESQVEVKVSDNGHGIAAANSAQIFTPFFTTKEQGRGNGLGLSVCQTIVRNHSGEISFESQEGKGTTFRVRLPSTRKA